MFTEWEEGKGRGGGGGHAGVRVPEGGRMLAITRRELHQVEKEGERRREIRCIEGKKGARNKQESERDREREGKEKERVDERTGRGRDR